MEEKTHLKLLRDEDYYQRLRRRINEWAKGKGRSHKYLGYLLAAPDLLHLMIKLIADRRVPTSCKAKLVVGIAYFLSPLDLLPELVLGPVGLLDDVAVAAWMIDSIIRQAGPAVVKEHWAGEGDVIEYVAGIVASANDMLGSGLVKRLKGVVDRQHVEWGRIFSANPIREIKRDK